jgi:hypothetical protein
MRHEAVLIDMDKVGRFYGNAGSRNLSAKEALRDSAQHRYPGPRQCKGAGANREG